MDHFMNLIFNLKMKIIYKIYIKYNFMVLAKLLLKSLKPTSNLPQSVCCYELYTTGTQELFSLSAHVRATSVFFNC